MREVGVNLVFSGLKYQVQQVMQKSGLVDLLGPDSFFSDKETALEALCRRVHDPAEAKRVAHEMMERKLATA